MTKVIYEPDELLMKAEGHAGGPRDAGYDMACCGVSSLMFALVAALEHYGIEADGYAADGVLKIRAKPDREMGQIAQVIYDAFGAGMELIAEKYPEYVRYDIR